MSDVEESVEVGENGDMFNLLKEVLKNAQVNGSLLHGIHEGAKALEKKLGKYLSDLLNSKLFVNFLFRFYVQECCACWPTTAKKLCTKN